MIALVDCDSFYASCERIFRPDLAHKPVVVLSNNDGCVIARSKEAKALDINMGAPWFKVKKRYLAKGGVVFSSNFALYGDISRRVMAVLKMMSPRTEIYSIDEAFLELSGISKHIGCEKMGITIKSTINKWTKIPVRIGIGPTKTLAKVASYQIKKYDLPSRVLVLNDKHSIEKALKETPIIKVWGVGSRLAKKLAVENVETAWDLSRLPPEYIKQKFNVVLERTLRELNGEQCLEIEDIQPTKKQIMVSRSFAHKVNDLSTLHAIINDFVARAAEKLRSEQQKCSSVSVFIRNSYFRKEEYEYGFNNFILPYPSDDTRDFLKVVNKMLPLMYKSNVQYSKAGVMLSSFSDSSTVQDVVFPELHQKCNSALMKTMDKLNYYGYPVCLASQNAGRFNPIQRKMVSPKYTTNWSDLPLVK